MWQQTLLQNFVKFRMNLTFFEPWLPWQRQLFWSCSTLKRCQTLRWIFRQSFMKFDERNPIFFQIPPFFVSMATAAKFIQPIPIFFAYLVPLDVANLINTPKPSTHYGEYSYDVSWSLMKEIKTILKSPFFISMPTAAKCVLPIPIFVAYLVPLDVDVKNLWSLEWF